MYVCMYVSYFQFWLSTKKYLFISVLSEIWNDFPFYFMELIEPSESSQYSRSMAKCDNELFDLLEVEKSFCPK